MANDELWPTATKMARELYNTFYQVGDSWYRTLIPRQERSIANQVVLITGSCNNLGRELALRFARRGARLVLWDSESKEQEVTKQLVTETVKGARVNGYVVDFTDTTSVRNSADLVKNDVGNVDLVIHTIGSEMEEKKVSELKSRNLERDFNQNVLSLFNVIDSILPQMMSSRKGQIVSLAGLGGHLGLPKLTSYCSSKYAVVGFLDSLRAELKSEGFDEIIITELSPFHCLPGVHSNGNKAILDSCTNRVADEATKRILRNESKIMVPFLWAWLLMSLKFFMPVESLFSLSRAISSGEIVFKSLATYGRARLDKVIAAIDKKPKPEAKPTPTKEPTPEPVKPQEGSPEVPSTPGSLEGSTESVPN